MRFTETTVEIPCLAIVTPYRFSATSMVLLLWVTRIIWEFAEKSGIRSNDHRW
ncbi:MAG: hypothetical protein QMD03_05485 [Syntrophales bacterium]|nr:hypothetical protein [Syntrophales bacterium]